MPRVSKTLTSTQIKNIKNQTVAVGGISGLYFRNNPRQSFFFYRFKDENGRHDISLGTFPEMSLAKARAEAATLRARIDAGIDVIAERKQAQAPKSAQKDDLIFEQVARKWYLNRSLLNFWGDNAKAEMRACQILEIHVYPIIGSKNINEVSADDVYDVLSKIWLTKHTTALKVKTSISKIFQWAMRQGKRRRLSETGRTCAFARA